MNRCIPLLLMTAACTLGAASQASSDYTIDWYVIGAGGGVSSGGPYELRGAIGQLAAHDTVADGGYALTGGFLAQTLTAASSCPGDTNGDNIVNFADLNAVLSQFGMSGSDLPGDTNSDGVVNFADLNLVLSVYGVECE